MCVFVCATCILCPKSLNQLFVPVDGECGSDYVCRCTLHVLIQHNPNTFSHGLYPPHLRLLGDDGLTRCMKRCVLPNQLELNEAVMNELKIAIILYETGASNKRYAASREGGKHNFNELQDRERERSITGNIYVNLWMFCLYFKRAKVYDPKGSIR